MVKSSLIPKPGWSAEKALGDSNRPSSVMLVLVLAAAGGSGCLGPIGGGAGGVHGATGDGGGVVGRDGGTGVMADGGGGGGAVGDGGHGALGGEEDDAGPSPWIDLVTRISIDAEAEIAENEKVPAKLEIRRYSDRSLVADGIHVGIKIRGHVSVRWPKKNYAIEIWDALGKDSEYDFLGMGAEEDWVLHGPYVDRSLLHNVVINHLSNQIGRYAPETRLASLAVRTPSQSDYKELGVYALMEQIRFSKDRLRVEKESPDGSKKAFLMQIDWTDDDKSYRTTAKKTPIFFVYPPDKSRTTADEDTALAVLNEFEASLDRPEQALDHIDQDAAADYFILTELARNPDGYRVSYYFHIPVGGLITFGPIWDFDLAFGISDWGNGTRVEGWQYEHQDSRYFRQLLQVSAFRQLVKARWQQLRQTELSDTAFENVVRTYVKRLGPDVIAANNTLWPFSAQIMLLSPKMAGYTEYDQVIEYMIDYGQSRMQWIDQQMQSW